MRSPEVGRWTQACSRGKVGSGVVWVVAGTEVKRWGFLKRAAKMVQGLGELGLVSLERRRLRGDLRAAASAWRGCERAGEGLGQGRE